MRHQNPSDAALRALLASARTIAVVGASSSPDRPSFGVMRKLRAAGFTVIPVNPNQPGAHPTLADVPEPVDIVNVFRRPEHTPAIADQAVAIGARALWLQSGIWNEDAAARATAGGLVVVMDACIAVMVALLGVRHTGG